MPKTSKAKATDGLPWLDVDAMRQAAGDRVFARGAAYHAGGQVEIVALDSGRVVARVFGSEIYRSELIVRDGEISGSCTCPAFSDWGFCKHLVASALAARDAGPGELEQASNRFSRIRDHLRAQGIEVLVGMIMGLAERDSVLLRNLELAAAASDADDETLFARFRKALVEAMRTRDFIGYREAHGWAQGIEDVLDRIGDLIDRGHADIVLRLLDYFFARMEDALEHVDDSDGHAGALFAQACEIHLKASARVRPDPIGLARDLFAREMGSEWGFFEGASEAYRDVLGDAGLAEYRRLAEEAWEKIRPLAGGERRLHDDQLGERYQVKAILDRFAERDGDVDARIAIRAKDLSLPHSYTELAELCLAHGRAAQALKWAEEGVRVFDDDPGEPLIACAAALYRCQGRKADAEGLLWRAFERSPSLAIYEQIRADTGGDQAAVRSISDRAVEVLRARIKEEGREEAPLWGLSSADLLVGLLMSDERFADAWNAVRAHGCGNRVLESLARASEGSHPAEAADAYAVLVERQLRTTGRRSYEEACRLIERIRVVRKHLGQDTAHAAYVEDLARRHKPKRNFIKLLRV